MAWKDVFGYMRSMAAKKGVGATERPEEGAPLGARIGSVVQVQRSPVIRAQAMGSLIAMPADGDTRVLALSQLRLEPDTELYRLYLATGDTDDHEVFLQVFGAHDGAVEEILFCTQLARIIPETWDDQQAYTGAAGYGLGDQSYTLWREQLAGQLDDATLSTVFGDGDSIDYTRDAGAPGAAFYPPFRGSETRIDDAEGKRGLRQELYFMPYVRQLAGGGKEYLLITTEIVESVDGDESKRDTYYERNNNEQR